MGWKCFFSKSNFISIYSLSFNYVSMQVLTMVTITFVCLYKMGGGDIATTFEMVRSLANNSLYSDDTINLIYFTLSEPPHKSSLKGITNYIHVKTANNSAGMRRENYSIVASESTVAQLIDLLQKSGKIVLYPRTPSETEDMCGWGAIYRQYLEPHKNKLITVTEPSGFEEEKCGYCPTQNRLHLGFHSASAGIPYPDVSSTAFTSQDAIQLRGLREESGARFFFIYGHTIAHLSRFIITIMNMNRNPANSIIFVIVGFNKYTRCGDVPVDSLKSYLDYEILQHTWSLGLEGEFSQIPSLTPLLSSEPRQALTNNFYFIHFQEITPMCFIELMSISENIVGCTGAHSLATAIALHKVPFYEALYDYHRGMFRDLMLSCLHMSPVLTYHEFLWDGKFLFDIHHPILQGQVSWGMLFNEFCRSVSSPELITEFCQTVRMHTDMMKKFPMILSEAIGSLGNLRAQSLFIHAAPSLESVAQVKSPTTEDRMTACADFKARLGKAHETNKTVIDGPASDEPVPKRPRSP